jgi:hypothetical protein
VRAKRWAVRERQRQGRECKGGREGGAKERGRWRGGRWGIDQRAWDNRGISDVCSEQRIDLLGLGLEQCVKGAGAHWAWPRTSEIVVYMALKVMQRGQVDIDLLQVRTHLLLHPVDLPDCKHGGKCREGGEGGRQMVGVGVRERASKRKEAAERG